MDHYAGSIRQQYQKLGRARRFWRGLSFSRYIRSVHRLLPAIIEPIKDAPFPSSNRATDWIVRHIFPPVHLAQGGSVVDARLQEPPHTGQFSGGNGLTTLHVGQGRQAAYHRDQVCSLWAPPMRDEPLRNDPITMAGRWANTPH